MSQNKINRRDFLRLAMAAAGGAALAACGASPPPAAQEQPTGAPAAAPPAGPGEAPAAAPATAAPPQTEAGTISYWAFWTQYGDAVKVFKPILEEKVKPHAIDIKTGVDAEQVFLTAVAAGTPPDIGT